MKQNAFERSAGILMPIISIPSPYGIGTFGREAYRFADNLAKAGQKYWQVLPLGPTGYGDSPYAPFSAFAGNPYFIDLELLMEEGLLEKEYIEGFRWNVQEQYVDYGLMYASRYQVLKTAFDHSHHRETESYQTFVKQNETWLEGYCLYSACKKQFGYLPWYDWDADIKFRTADAIARYRKQLKEDMEFYCFRQFKFFEQWKALKQYVNAQGIEVIGDIPIYMALDSADVWQFPEIFQLDADLNPEVIAGVPPDAFSEEGQCWGNPLYNWEKLEEDDFYWWKMRIAYLTKIYDVMRIDHFIGLTKYYSIPTKNKDARNGQWQEGPGMRLIKVIHEAAGGKKIIAEDLGIELPEVCGILNESGYPGMRVMEFAFDGNRQNKHLPYHWEANIVAYGGTHDNDTLVGYFKSLEWWELNYLRKYMGDERASIEELVDAIFRTAYASVANVVIFQMQDVLKIGHIGRMNLPASMGTNWRWRMGKEDFSSIQIEKLRYLSDIYGRLAYH